MPGFWKSKLPIFFPTTEGTILVWTSFSLTTLESTSCVGVRVQNPLLKSASRTLGWWIGTWGGLWHFMDGQVLCSVLNIWDRKIQGVRDNLKLGLRPIHSSVRWTGDTGHHVKSNRNQSLKWGLTQLYESRDKVKAIKACLLANLKSGCKEKNNVTFSSTGTLDLFI